MPPLIDKKPQTPLAQLKSLEPVEELKTEVAKLRADIKILLGAFKKLSVEVRAWQGWCEQAVNRPWNQTDRPPHLSDEIPY